MSAAVLYRRLRSLLVYIDRYLRLILDPTVTRKAALLWTCVKLRALKALRPSHEAPIRLGGRTISYGTFGFLWQTHHEIYVRRLYARHAPATAARIIDGGANIGLAALYYRQAYPGCEIICFEPDPRNFELLSRNLAGLDGIERHQLALSDRTGTAQLHQRPDTPGDTCSSIQATPESGDSQDAWEAIPVETTTLRPWLGEPVDILKLDIEGGELGVLAAIKDELPSVGSIQLEYHQLDDNRFADLLTILDEAGHEYWIEYAESFGSRPGSVAMIYTRRR